LREEAPDFADDPWVLVSEKSEVVISKLGEFLRDYLLEARKSGYVMGLSGGLDSSTLAVLLRKTLGRSGVLALIMPDRDSPPEDVRDAVEVAETFDIEYIVIDLAQAVDSLLLALGERRDTVDPVAAGNLKARLRMATLYFFANSRNLLVASTTNRSEYLLGYFTKWGDVAGDVHPLLPFYKTQVRILGEKLGLPEKILRKPSSPGFWAGQKSEVEIGAPFEIVDRILHYAVDRQEPLDEVANRVGASVELVRKIWERVSMNEHKRLLTRPFPIFPAVLSEALERDLSELQERVKES